MLCWELQRLGSLMLSKKNQLEHSLQTFTIVSAYTWISSTYQRELSSLLQKVMDLSVAPFRGKSNLVLIKEWCPSLVVVNANDSIVPVPWQILRRSQEGGPGSKAATLTPQESVQMKSRLQVWLVARNGHRYNRCWLPNNATRHTDWPFKHITNTIGHTVSVKDTNPDCRYVYCTVDPWHTCCWDYDHVDLETPHQPTDWTLRKKEKSSNQVRHRYSKYG